MILCMNEYLPAVENSRKNSYFDKNTKGKKKTIKQPAVFLNGRAVSAVAASGRTRRICECFHDWEAENRIWIKLQEKS